jgi:hypothetical protein
MSKVILTLTTIPSRLTATHDEGIKANLSSLLNQSYEDYEIHFNVPKLSTNTGKTYEIPEWIRTLSEENPKFKIFEDVLDIGPITKSFYTINRSTDPEDIIIVVDDDLVYHEDLISEHIKNQEKFPGCAVGYDGMRSRDNFFNDQRDHYFTSNYRSSVVDVLQHYKSISYKRKYFEDDFNEFFRTNSDQWNDDYIISAYLATKNIDRIATYHSSDTKFETLDEWINGGGVATFPVLRHTAHEGQEGCWHFRNNPEINEKALHLLIKYIDPERHRYLENLQNNG